MSKTCNNCLHRELCNVHGYIDADECACFKDKSRYIELPCAVGDVVYFDCCGYHDSAEIDGIHIDAQGISFTWVQYDVGVDITELWDEGEFDIEEIGKTVFLTKEEAEQKIKEIRNEKSNY